jgi:hypothetical protein
MDQCIPVMDKCAFQRLPFHHVHSSATGVPRHAVFCLALFHLALFYLAHARDNFVLYSPAYHAALRLLVCLYEISMFARGQLQPAACPG